MVNMRKGFGGATGADKLEATGAVVEASFLGKMAMSRQEVQAVAKVKPANNAPSKKR